MITGGNLFCFDLVTNSSNLYYEIMYRDQSGEQTTFKSLDQNVLLSTS